jgi:general transcription factor 3C polypeptide 3 (transcription factor C subunit 4)
MEYHHDGNGTNRPPQSQESAYPDIDETMQYPWQGTQPAVAGESSLHSVIDPRLYKDLFSRNASQLPDQHAMDYEDEEDAEEYSHMDDSAEDSTYEFSAEETSTSVVIRNRLVLITDVL